ncbi:uncharacterized protein F5147DRAFT_807316 [Suillus discolor]|uniref:Uncharacterized protein n=1 Tax=Suillus discolor TaxID=1912936 RepID=A0A9P7JZ75_9AGAM|nr:uncharacterized protein F5147DRAFT_807316 [Suillus discolor]KAG2118186.1 hypothetical protein F5147DRAFT_807316 [Suillus discolor]
MLAESEVSTVETHFQSGMRRPYKYCFDDLHPSSSIPYTLHLLPLRTHTHSHNILLNYLLAQMTQSPSYPSSHGSDSSNANQDTPNTGMHMGQFPWPHPAHMHHPGYAPAPPAPPCFPYGVPPPMYQQSFPSGHFPGVMTSNATYTSYQPYLHQHHGAGLVTGSASPSSPQAPSLSVGDKRVVNDLQDRNVKRIKMSFDGIEDDPLFAPMIDQHGQHDGRYMCFKDGMLVRPGSYKRHLKTEKHLGYKPTEFACPRCLHTYTRRDACKRHWEDSCGKLPVNGARLSYAAACRAFTSFNSALATASFMPHLPATATTTSHSSPPEIIPTDAVNPYSWAASDIQDPPLVAPVLPPFEGQDTEVQVAPVLTPSEGQDIALVEVHNPLAADAMQEPPLATPVLPPSEVREITLAEVRGCIPFWRWINDTEGLVDPLPPITEPPSSRLPEAMLVDAAEDPDVWRLINEIDDFVDPEIPLCESSTDAAEDPDFCNFPIRTLLVCSWLDNSYGSDLHQRSPSELPPLSSTPVDHEM